MKRRYGRCMGKNEFKRTKKTSILDDDGRGEVPVFDCPKYVEKRLLGMNKKELEEHFRGIGVREAYAIIFFEVDEELAKENLPQKNGLKEYLIPTGTKIEIDYWIKL